MNCSKCGQPLDPGASFCGSCGQQLVQTNTGQAQSVVGYVSQPVVPTPPIAPMIPQPPQAIDPNQQSQATMSQVIANQQPSVGSSNFGTPVMSANSGYNGAIPSYATPAVPVDHGGERLAIIGLIFGVIGIPASLIPIIGLAFGITGIILSTIAHKRYKHLMTTLAIIFSSISIVLALGLWVFAIQHALSTNHSSTPVSSLNSSKNGGSSSSVGLTTVDSPCYSVQIDSGLNNYKPTGCSFDSANYNTEYTVNAATNSNITASNLQTIGQKALSQASSALGVTVTSQHVGTFAGAPAYIAYVSKASTSEQGILALALKTTSHGENFFMAGHFTKGGSQTASFGPIESNWTWK